MFEKILVVDDENNIRNTTMRLLQKKGYFTDGAGSGTEALKKIRTQSYDLVLLDVKMPDMSGLEVLRRTSEIKPELVVLIITGYGAIETAIEALELGASGFIRKPITDLPPIVVPPFKLELTPV